MVRLGFFPQTKWGRWSVWLLVGLFVFYAMRFFVRLIPFLRMGTSEGFFGNIPMAVLMILAWASGSLAFFTGLAAFLKKERGLLVVVTMLLGLFVFAFGIGEVLYPH